MQTTDRSWIVMIATSGDHHEAGITWCVMLQTTLSTNMTKQKKAFSMLLLGHIEKLSDDSMMRKDHLWRTKNLLLIFCHANQPLPADQFGPFNIQSFTHFRNLFFNLSLDDGSFTIVQSEDNNEQEKHSELLHCLVVVVELNKNHKLHQKFLCKSCFGPQHCHRFVCLTHVKFHDTHLTIHGSHWWRICKKDTLIFCENAG